MIVPASPFLAIRSGWPPRVPDSPLSLRLFCLSVKTSQPSSSQRLTGVVDHRRVGHLPPGPVEVPGDLLPAAALVAGPEPARPFAGVLPGQQFGEPGDPEVGAVPAQPCHTAPPGIGCWHLGVGTPAGGTRHACGRRSCRRSVRSRGATRDRPIASPSPAARSWPLSRPTPAGSPPR